MTQDRQLMLETQRPPVMRILGRFVHSTQSYTRRPDSFVSGIACCGLLHKIHLTPDQVDQLFGLNPRTTLLGLER